jgi:predicted O-methyltransferase YrrM
MVPSPFLTRPRGTVASGCRFGNDGRSGPVPRPLGCDRPISLSEEAVIAAPPQASREYAESFLPEDEALATARSRGEQMGAPPLAPVSGAALCFLAAAMAARHVVEIGTGAGVSGIWLLRGMAPDGVLTSIDVEAEHQRLARRSYTEAGIPANRVRLINGRALDVLPRLTDGAYDLVLCDAEKTEYADYLAEALRLLRPGGVVVFDNALWHDRVADPSVRDAATTVVRELGATVRDDERLVPVLLPVGDGLLAAVKRG